MANPAIVFTNGSITTSASEQTLWELIADRYSRGYLNLKNMTASETFRVKVYIWDEFLGEYVKVTQTDYASTQDPQGKRLEFEAATRYKVTIQRTAGTDKVVTWLRAQV